MTIDYASFRSNTDHLEVPRNGTSYCAVCGDVGELEVTSLAARVYHGDSFGLELSDEEHEELEAQAGKLTTAELKAERCALCESTDLRHHNRTSSCSACGYRWMW